MLVGAQMEAAGRQGRKGGRIGDSVCERSLHIIESSEPKVGEGTLARIQEKPVSERECHRRRRPARIPETETTFQNEFGRGGPAKLSLPIHQYDNIRFKVFPITDVCVWVDCRWSEWPSPIPAHQNLQPSGEIHESFHEWVRSANGKVITRYMWCLYMDLHFAY